MSTTKEAQLGTAFVFFGKPLSADTATALIGAFRTLVSERDANQSRLWDHIYLTIACGGGDVIGAFGAYNELRALPISITTHNVGAVDSSAIMLMMTGAQRLASRASAFFFHQTAWTFPAQGQLASTTINDATKWLRSYEGMMAEAVEERTHIPKAEVLRMMHEGTSLSPDEALKLGLIDSVKEHSIPWDARTMWV